MKQIAYLTVAVAFGVLAAGAFAQEETGKLVVSIEEIAGSVEYRPSEDARWHDATAGLKLSQGAELSTGLASKAALALGDNSIVVLGSFTEVSIDKFFKDAEAVRTMLRMKSGTLRAKVRSDRVRSDFKVVTPNMTASVTGTKIKEVTTSPDMGDYIGMGDEGHLVVETEKGKRHVDPNTATTSQLIRLVEQAKLAHTFWFSPFMGLTDEEGNAAFNKPDQLDVSPAEPYNPTASPLGDFVANQEGRGRSHENNGEITIERRITWGLDN